MIFLIYFITNLLQLENSTSVPMIKLKKGDFANRTYFKNTKNHTLNVFIDVYISNVYLYHLTLIVAGKHIKAE